MLYYRYMSWFKKIADAGFKTNWVPYMNPKSRTPVTPRTEISPDIIMQTLNLLRAALSTDNPKPIVSRAIDLLEKLQPNSGKNRI